MPQITLCPPGACPPESTTPIFKLWLGVAPALLGTRFAEGCPNRLGKSFAISSALLLLRNEFQTNLYTTVYRYILAYECVCACAYSVVTTLLQCTPVQHAIGPTKNLILQ